MKRDRRLVDFVKILISVVQKLVEWVKIPYRNFGMLHSLVEVYFTRLEEITNSMWLMLKLREFRPLVEVNQARMCIDNFKICVSENLVEWLIFQLQLKMSEVGFKN